MDARKALRNLFDYSLVTQWGKWTQPIEVADFLASDPNRRADAERWRDSSPELTREERQMLIYSD